MDTELDLKYMVEDQKEIIRLREGLRKIQIKIHHWEHDVKRDFPLSPMDFTATAMYIDHLLEGKE